MSQPRGADKPAPRKLDVPPFHPARVAPPESGARRRRVTRKKPGDTATLLAIVGSGLWIGVIVAFAWGYMGPNGLGSLDFIRLILLVAGIVLPAALILLAGVIAYRAEALRLTSEDLANLANRLTRPEETAAGEVQRVGTAVRRETDALNAGIENALSRVQALEGMLNERTTDIERTTLNVAERVDEIRFRLREERERLGEIVSGLKADADQIGVAIGRSAGDIKGVVESAAREMTGVQSALNADAERFRNATLGAVEGARLAVKEIEQEAARLETAAEETFARTDSLHQRTERHRALLQEAVEHLRNEGRTIDASLKAQREGLEQLGATLADQSERMEGLIAEGTRKLDALATQFGGRIDQLSSGFSRESERVRVSGDAARAVLDETKRALEELLSGARAGLAAEARQAQERLEALIAKSAAAHEAVTATMGDVTEKADATLTAIDEAATRLRRLMDGLPDEAGAHAARVRTIIEQEVSSLVALTDRLVAVGREPAAPPAASAPEPVQPRATPKLAAVPRVEPSLQPTPLVVRSEPKAAPVERAIAEAPPPQIAPSRAKASQRGAPPLVASRPEPDESEEEPERAEPKLAPLSRPRVADPITQKATPTGDRGWLGFAKRLTSGRSEPSAGGATPWRLSTVLAAADRAHAESPATERSRLLSLVARVTEALSAEGIDVPRALEFDIPMRDWEGLRHGDREPLVRRAEDAIDGVDRTALDRAYTGSEAFRTIADRYLRQFDSMLEAAAVVANGWHELERDLTGDPGRVYLLIAQAAGRLDE
ncbi:MAG: hypothetical protein GC199_10680 [Alphaproteobacteria bacterium]|nr:hypothetical protein [Alphaproteobacteria bacterium]